MGCNLPDFKPVPEQYPVFRAAGYCVSPESRDDLQVLRTPASFSADSNFSSFMLGQCWASNSLRVVDANGHPIVFNSERLNIIRDTLLGHSGSAHSQVPITQFHLNGTVSSAEALGQICFYRPAFLDSQNRIADVEAFDDLLTAFDADHCPQGLVQEDCAGVHEVLSQVGHSSKQSFELYLPSWVRRHPLLLVVGSIVLIPIVASAVASLVFEDAPLLRSVALRRLVENSPRLKAFLERHPILKEWYEHIRDRSNRRPPDDPTASAPVTPAGRAPAAAPAAESDTSAGRLMEEVLAQDSPSPSQTFVASPSQYLQDLHFEERYPALLRGVIQFLAPVIFSPAPAGVGAPVLVPAR